MGNFENSFELGAGMEVKLPDAVYIVANPGAIAQLRAQSAGAPLAGATFVELACDADIPAHIVAAASVLVMEVAPAERSSVRRIAKVRSARHDLPLIAAVPDANIALVRTLVRQGVTDVAVLPFDANELVGQILDASAAAEASREGNHSLAPMLCVVRSIGGCGATSVITQLAAELAQSDSVGSGICVIDLDLQSGCVASFLGVQPSVTVGDLLEAGERLDSEFLTSAVCDSGRGFSVIAAPDAITPLEAIDVDQVLKLLTLARQQFSHVLIDLPAGWTNWALSVAVSASDLLLITDLTIASLRQAKRRLDLFGSVGVPRERIRVAVNRVERRLFKTIGVDEVRVALDCEVLGTLTAEGPALSSAQDQGLLISENTHKSKFAADIRKLAHQLEAGD